MASDTLSISRDLRQAGFSEEQADALAMQIAGMPANLVTRDDLALAMSRIETRIEQLDHRIDQLDHRIDQFDHRIDQLDHKTEQIEPRLLLKLGAGMVAGFGLTLTAIGIGVAVLLDQLG